MKTEHKGIKIKSVGETCVQKSGNTEKKSQVETIKSYLIEMSLQDYGQLARRALVEGCSPEELVARRISALLSREK